MTISRVGAMSLPIDGRAGSAHHAGTIEEGRNHAYPPKAVLKIRLPTFRPPESGPRTPEPPKVESPQAGFHPLRNGESTPADKRAGTDSGLPARYIARSGGKFQPDPRSPGIFFDDKGQRYIESDGKRYAARYDSANQTWRVVQPDDPTRPGIPVKQNSDGSWSSHSEVGGAGGNPGAGPAQALLLLQQQHAQLQETLDALQAREQAQRLRIVDMEGLQRRIEEEIRTMEGRGAPEETLWERRQYLRDVWQTLQTMQQGLNGMLQERQFHVQQLQQVRQQMQQLQ